MGKRAKDDREVVLDLIFTAFQQHEYYNFKDLVQKTKQPVVSDVACTILCPGEDNSTSTHPLMMSWDITYLAHCMVLPMACSLCSIHCALAVMACLSLPPLLPGIPARHSPRGVSVQHKGPSQEHVAPEARVPTLPHKVWIRLTTHPATPTIQLHHYKNFIHVYLIVHFSKYFNYFLSHVDYIYRHLSYKVKNILHIHVHCVHIQHVYVYVCMYLSLISAVNSNNVQWALNGNMELLGYTWHPVKQLLHRLPQWQQLLVASPESA